MARKTKKATYWTDGRGYQHDITKISDEYLQNIIAWLQRRKKHIREAANEEGYELDEILQDHSGDLQTMLDEVVRRSEEEIYIPREEGAEERYRD